jgi:uncharacterized protein YegJ (DUF2314 family)
MPLPLKLALAAVFIAALWAFVRWRHPRPEFMPLETKADDPLLLQAMETARSTLPEFLRRLGEPRESAAVKLRFVSSSNQVEHLWAEVLERLGPEELGVRLVTPPVTHTGQLDRLYRCALSDVEDWQIGMSSGQLHGGFTQRAMFAIARRDGVRLPAHLAEQERRYGDV